MNRFFLFLLIGSALISPAAELERKAPPRTFFANQFPGLIGGAEAGPRSKLDLDFENADGTKTHLSTCEDLAKVHGDSLAGADYQAFRLLRLHCEAARRFAGSSNAVRTSFPESF